MTSTITSPGGDPVAPPGLFDTAPSTGAPASSRGGRITRSTRRLWRGPEEDPAWARPALLPLLGATAVLYVWGLVGLGLGNVFYSAAVQAGTKSWRAFFFGSFDSSNFITVD